MGPRPKPKTKPNRTDLFRFGLGSVSGSVRFGSILISVRFGSFFLKKNRTAPPDAQPYTHRKLTSSPRPHLKPRVHTRTRNTANTLVCLLKVQERTLGDLNTLITNKHSHNNTPIGWIYQWIAQVFVRKIRMRVVEEKLKKFTFNTLDKLSFWLEIFALKQVEKTS